MPILQQEAVVRLGSVNAITSTLCRVEKQRGERHLAVGFSLFLGGWGCGDNTI